MRGDTNKIKRAGGDAVTGIEVPRKLIAESDVGIAGSIGGTDEAQGFGVSAAESHCGVVRTAVVVEIGRCTTATVRAIGGPVDHQTQRAATLQVRDGRAVV